MVAMEVATDMATLAHIGAVMAAALAEEVCPGTCDMWHSAHSVQRCIDPPPRGPQQGALL